MWSFFILCLQVYILHDLLVLLLFSAIFSLSDFFQAMIIVAWNGNGEPSAIFDGNVFKKVLSVFITAAILKLAQGLLTIYFTVSFKFHSHPKKKRNTGSNDNHVQ